MKKLLLLLVPLLAFAAGPLAPISPSIPLSVSQGGILNANFQTGAGFTTQAGQIFNYVSGTVVNFTNATVQLPAGALSPGGTNGQYQYNNNGIFGGISGANLINAILPSQTGITNGWVLTTNGTTTSWGAPGGSGSGNVSTSGTITSGYLAVWNGSTTIVADQYLPAGNFPALTGDVTSTHGAVGTTVVGINGTSMAGLGTGLIKNTTSTGVPSIAVAGTDYLGITGASTITTVGPLSTGSIVSGFSSINATPIGNSTPSTVSSTNLSSSGTVSGTGFSSYLASPPAIGSSVAAPVAATNLSSSGTVGGTGFTNYLASPPAIGGTAPNAISATNLSSSGSISGNGFLNYFASPPPLGSTSANTVTGTSITGTSETINGSSTLNGVATFTAQPNVHIPSAHSLFQIERDSSTYDSMIIYNTNGTNNWLEGVNNGATDFGIYDYSVGNFPLSISYTTGLTSLTSLSVSGSSGFSSLGLGSVFSSSSGILSSRQDVFNVKDYGAKGNGSNDDTAAIQNAINAACAATPSEVYFPAGIYKKSASLVLAANFIGKVSFVGSGIHSSIILDSTSSTDGFNFDLTYSTGGSDPPATNIVEISELGFMCGSGVTGTTAINILGSTPSGNDAHPGISIHDIQIGAVNQSSGGYINGIAITGNNGGVNHAKINNIYAYGSAATSDTGSGAGSGDAIQLVNFSNDELGFIIMEFWYKGISLECAGWSGFANGIFQGATIHDITTVQVDINLNIIGPSARYGTGFQSGYVYLSNLSLDSGNSGTLSLSTAIKANYVSDIHVTNGLFTNSGISVRPLDLGHVSDFHLTNVKTLSNTGGVSCVYGVSLTDSDFTDLKFSGFSTDLSFDSGTARVISYNCRDTGTITVTYSDSGSSDYIQAYPNQFLNSAGVYNTTGTYFLLNRPNTSTPNLFITQTSGSNNWAFGANYTPASGTYVDFQIYDYATSAVVLDITNGTGLVTLNAGLTVNNTAITANAGEAVVGLVDLSNASSGNIKFPATQNTSANANTLDDYQNGTFTPTLNSFTIVSGTGGVTAAGTYIKVGHILTVNIVISGTGTATIASIGGTSNITGLPVASRGAIAGFSGSWCYSGINQSGGLFITGTTLYPTSWTAITPANGTLVLTGTYFQ